MADRSNVEWTDATWTPIRAKHKVTGKVGWHCTHATPGCVRCYAEGMNKRLGTGLPFKPGHADDIELFLDEQMLLAPLRWKKPRMIFVCSMTDLFADFVPDEWIDRVFAIMALTPHHTYQVLTKRSARMRAYLNDPDTPRRVFELACEMALDMDLKVILLVHPSQEMHAPPGPRVRLWVWPLPNVWLGVSAEDQRRADERIPDLLATPAAIRFVSAEPLLGPIDFSQFLWPVRGWWKGPHSSYAEAKAAGAECGQKRQALVGAWCRFVDWMIVGGESGRAARPMHPDWARRIRDQCAAAGAAFFFKQWGEWAPSTPELAYANPRSGWRCLAGHPHVAKAHELYPENGAAFIEHMGKKRAGRLLDGVQHDAMPEPRRG